MVYLDINRTFLPVFLIQVHLILLGIGCLETWKVHLREQIKSKDVHQFIGGIRDTVIEYLLYFDINVLKVETVSPGFVYIKYLYNQNRPIRLC